MCLLYSEALSQLINLIVITYIEQDDFMFSQCL